MYKTVIGLEVHCELKSNSKNFSASKNSYSTIPNTNVSVIDLGMPGILPTINKEAVKNSIKMALAMNCKIPKYLTFERKNYFYPDLPKGYQITQFKNPIGTNGYVMIKCNGSNKKILIHDTHLEEDTASLDHYNTYSLIDYNRCGVPLLETVTEPCINSADEAICFLETLRSIFLYCDTSYARSDRGQIRCDVNISLMKENDTKLGTRVEIKNINSFSSVKEAILSEVNRQTEILNNGGTIEQETRRFDELTNQTIPMRSKEDAIDYRYYTDPNLPPIELTEKWVNEIKTEIPVLQFDRLNKYIDKYGINIKDATTIVKEKEISDYFEECINISKDIIPISNWLTGSILGNMNKLGITIKELYLKPQMLVDLINLINSGTISGKQAKEVLEKVLTDKKDPNTIVKEMNISQITNSEEIKKIVKEILTNNPNLVEDYKNGKKVFDYLIGQIMKNTKGRANPVISSNVLKEELELIQKN